jgi:cell shape-determining protein MreC
MCSGFIKRNSVFVEDKVCGVGKAHPVFFNQTVFCKQALIGRVVKVWYLNLVDI